MSQAGRDGGFENGAQPASAPKPTIGAEPAAGANALDSQFWESRYAAKDTGWDLGGASPPFVEFFARADAPKPPMRVLVPGCGRGHDALHLAKWGFDVTAVDFARPALDALRRRRRNLWIPPAKCRTLRADVLRLPARFAGAFDLLLEYTCYCAIDPSKRDAYARMAAAVLVPGGELVALFYPFRDAEGGPPFPVTEAGLRAAFGESFEVESWETPAGSVERRRGEERLVVMRRR